MKLPLTTLLLLTAWTLLGLFFASETFFALGLAGRPITWGQALLYELPGWYIWALFAPAIVWLSARVRFERSRYLYAALFHLTASALFSLLQLTLETALTRALQPARTGAPSFTESLRFVLETGSHFNLIAYWGVLCASYALVYHRRNQERDLRATQLEARLAQARLQVLEMELQPHFLFNTLNTVSALVHRDPDAAERMIARLGDLLRLTLDHSAQQEVTLEQELELLQRYLEIEQTRFRDRLTVNVEVEPAALSARVPRLLLQPIVENAIRHGIARRSAPGRIDVGVVRRAGALMLTVSDNGPGLRERPVQPGIGLSNTRERLRQLYRDGHSLELRDRPEGGLAVTVAIPFHEQGVTAHA
jgi:two-component system, LytTR family, sensor kinase